MTSTALSTTLTPMKSGCRAALFRRPFISAFGALTVALFCLLGGESKRGPLPAAGIAGTVQTNFSVVLIPDSQYLTGYCTNEWNDQMAYIRNNAGALNIKAAIHLGDLVDAADDRQLAAAMHGLDTLRASGVPFILAPGNHDCDGGTGDPLDLAKLS